MMKNADNPAHHPALLCLKICLVFTLWMLVAKPSAGQCSQIYDWTTWNSFSPTQSNGTIFTNGQNIGVTMSANYQFGSTPGIYGFGAFNSFNGSLPPNSLVPSTTWAVGPGGITTMCFSQTVSNPVLLLASIGNSGNAVTLRFSLPYLPVFTGQQVTFVNDTTLIGREGYTIIMFPGNFDCVTIFSNTPEFYTNITWGLNPPLFPISIFGDTTGCQSVTLTAEGGTTYAWSGGSAPDSATNVFLESGVYFLTVTDDNDCAVITSVSVDIPEAVTMEISQTICQGTSFEGYSSGGTYTDVFTLPSGCDSTRILNLTVLPSPMTTVDTTICQGASYAGYSSGGTYTDVFTLPSGCDSTRILNLTVLPSPVTTVDTTICQGASYAGYSSGGTYTDIFTLPGGCDSMRLLILNIQQPYLRLQSTTLCPGGQYDFNGRIISSAGIYTDTLQTFAGCDSVLILEVTAVESFEFLGADTVVCKASTFTMRSPSERTRWFDGELSNAKTVGRSGEYQAFLLDDSGCEIADTISVQFNLDMFVPNAFSPNDDGINDCFQPLFSEMDSIKSYRLSIFDQWGNHIFSTSDPRDCWNGETRENACALGVYGYYLEMSTAQCGPTLLKGDLTLVR